MSLFPSLAKDDDPLEKLNELQQGSLFHSIEYELSDIVNPYLPPIGIIKYYGGNRMLALAVQLRQVEYRTVTKKIITDKALWENGKYTKNNVRSLLIKAATLI